MNLDVDSTVMVTTRQCQPLSTEKAVVELQPHSLWAHLLHEQKVVGIVILGNARIAVDVIAETDAGAVGESITDELEGFHIILGQVNMDEASQEASPDDLQTAGIQDATSFREKASAILEETKFNKTRVPSLGTTILIGHTVTSSGLVLVLSNEKLVLVYQDLTYAVGSNSLVQIGKNGIRIFGRRGGVLETSPHHARGCCDDEVFDVDISMPSRHGTDIGRPPHLPRWRVPRHDWRRETHGWDPDWIV